MIPRAVLAAALGALLGLNAGCAEPTRVLELPKGAVPAPLVLTRPGAVYQGLGRYILYEDGTFTWDLEGSVYHGRYAGPTTAIAFSFDGDPNWAAVGTLRGETLTVTVNALMSTADFPSGVYTRVPSAR
jgi:hypothetical protein